MSYEPIALLIPVIYAALQFDAITRMDSSWKSAAYAPAGFMCIAFGIQIMVGVGSFAAAAWVPIVAMCVSCVYLAALNVFYDRALRLVWDEADEIAHFEASENVVSLADYRSEA